MTPVNVSASIKAPGPPQSKTDTTGNRVQKKDRNKYTGIYLFIYILIKAFFFMENIFMS